MTKMGLELIVESFEAFVCGRGKYEIVGMYKSRFLPSVVVVWRDGNGVQHISMKKSLVHSMSGWTDLHEIKSEVE